MTVINIFSFVYRRKVKKVNKKNEEKFNNFLYSFKINYLPL